ncbi:uncharacterized protein LOC129729046 [Wyeomyia smithii]|uniref:uncharacterized protein LOC129729046 n=1 Tax=Wyeomyia smithii TaxID=174621 RepID=UPI002467CD3C|nr:uncharacterized protein LOC129729046 [Wyeomyia smithii]
MLRAPARQIESSEQPVVVPEDIIDEQNATSGVNNEVDDVSITVRNKVFVRGGSRISHRSRRSSAINASQIRALELVEEFEEDELHVSSEQDRIVAEQRLEELKIQKELELKSQQKKAEFLRKKRERTIQINELRSRSDSSCCSSFRRVQDCQNWVNASELPLEEPEYCSVRPDRSVRSDRQDRPDYAAFPVRPEHPDRSGNLQYNVAATGTNEVLCQAFKALQNRRVRDLPQFSGNIMDWPIFENEFRTSTAECKLTDRKNLRRLNNALQGKARKTVESLLSDPENVGLVMKMLKSNFGRTDWVVANRMEQLRNLDPVKDGNIESFRSFFNTVIGTAAALKNVKADVYLMNPELTSHLAEKLPPFSKQMWVRHKASLMKGDKLVDFHTFSRWLEDEMKNQLASINPHFFGKKDRKDQQFVPFTKPKPPVLNVNTREPEQKGKCPLCKLSGHVSLVKCEQFAKLSVEQRRSVARSCRVCYLCLKQDHSRRDCRSDRTCSLCDQNHHELVHSDIESKKPARKIEKSSEDLCHVNGRDSNTLLRIGRVKIRCNGSLRIVFALFDEGSSLSMVDAELADQMKLRGPISPVTYRWTNGISHKDDTSMLLSLHVSGPAEKAKWYEMSNVRTINNINLPRVSIDIEKIERLYSLLEEDKLAAIQNAVPKMLIGSNNAGLIVPLKTVQYSTRGLQLTRCHLSWTIHGEVEPATDDIVDQFHVFICNDQDLKLTELVREMYKVEDFGIKQQDPKMSEEDERALDIMNRTLKRNGDRFEVGKLYKYNNFTFPDSKPQALRRLAIIEKKMDADQKFAEQYCQKIEDYIEKGYARKLRTEELPETPNTWYLSHFSVVNANKFRLVMDAKAKSHGFSLNDLLLKGSDFVPSLIGVLIRGRQKKIAFMADIKEMFHQILIRQMDQNSQRFFWRGMDRTSAPQVYVMMAMIFGAVSSPSIAQFIKNFNARELEDRFPGVERAIVRQHYVDDYFDSTDSEIEAIILAKNVIEAHKQGGFKLVKFVSNSSAVLKSLDPAMRAEPKADVHVLGLQWHLSTDEFVFPLNFPKLDTVLRSGAGIPTKRQLLKFMMGIFDPLSKLSPITIHLKILFQDL